jgi:hypothetical protein
VIAVVTPRHGVAPELTDRFSPIGLNAHSSATISKGLQVAGHRQGWQQRILTPDVCSVDLRERMAALIRDLPRA